MDNSSINPQKKQLLGEILVQRKLISNEQLKQALDIQTKERGFLGEILVNCGYIDDKDIIVALILQCNVPYIAIDKYDVDRSIVQLISEDMARKYHLVALDRVGDVLSVVMADPLDVAIKAEVQRNTKCQIATFIASKNEIERAINRLYGG